MADNQTIYDLPGDSGSKGAEHTYSNQYGSWTWNDEVAPTSDEYSKLIDEQIDNLPPDAIAWLTSLAEYSEWRTPTGEKQNVGDWINFLSTDQGKGWWGGLTPQAKSTLQPDYGEVNYRGAAPTPENPGAVPGISRTALEPFFTEGSQPGGLGAAQRGSTPQSPVFSFPSIKGDVTLSAEQPYGYQPGGGGSSKKSPYSSPYGSTKSGGQSIFRESDFPFLNTGRVAPPARWLLY
jgi:hypothetical protein